MSPDILFIFAVIFVLMGYIWFGHYSIWGKLANKHTVPAMLASNNKGRYVNIGIRINGQWKGGIRAKCYSDKSGIIFETRQFVKLITPSVFIPWDDVRKIEPSNEGFMRTNRLKITINDGSVCLLVPEDCKRYLGSESFYK